jgi:hypothetical protein
MAQLENGGAEFWEEKILRSDYHRVVCPLRVRACAASVNRDYSEQNNLRN